ncbi:DUF2971 domain-containing protein [Mangrovibacterium diazotrophicum]|uniref:DUF2971 family protein n=1 Tax=Mangrovibacterium diazotrophicum TaxID=1261403 RepID=A0A419W4T5_9BACT|nr:DUF2971 domain-containing protein [Mangrovibacterium diazotrophicum]RKD90463.1 Protein of unknown function (DUF2971) [Mangrovibacterium diazotrophicum]
MILYKYVNQDRVDILKNRKIRFTQYYNQNDPYDCTFALMPLDKEKEDAEEDDYRAERAQLEVYLEEKFSQLGMLCLTEDPSNLLMWSHYAGNHKGMVIGFDTSNQFFNTTEKLYDHHYGGYDYLPTEGFGTVKSIEYLEKRKFAKIGEKIRLHDIFFTKSVHWSYEKEYRIIKNINDFEPVEIDSDIYLLPFPINAITEIIIGANADQMLYEDIRLIVQNDFKDKVEIKKAKLKHTAFGLDYVGIKNHT